MKFPTGPEVKLPKLKLRRSSAEAEEATTDEERADDSPKKEATGKRPQPPALVQDVYRDLRDRRLLLPAAGLLLALLLVPVLLRATPEPAPPPSPPDVLGDAAAAMPAVLAEQETGIRDYRKRLNELKAKNPFKAKLQLKPQEVAERTAISEPPDPSGGGAGSGGGNAPSPAPGSPSEPPRTEPLPQPKPDQPTVRSKLVTPVAKVLVGRVGEKKRKKELRPTEPIPGKERTLAVLAGYGDSFDSVVFLVSRHVATTRGDGRCRPSARECDLVVMKPGDARSFDLERSDGSTRKFRLKLLKIRTEIADERDLKGK